MSHACAVASSLFSANFGFGYRSLGNHARKQKACSWVPYDGIDGFKNSPRDGTKDNIGQGIIFDSTGRFYFLSFLFLIIYASNHKITAPGQRLQPPHCRLSPIARLTSSPLHMHTGKRINEVAIECRSDDVMALIIVMVPNKSSLHQASGSGMEPGTCIVSNRCDH